MKAFFAIQHPAHVHLFRNSIQQLESDGHEIHTLVRENDINVQLLENYGIEHTVVAPEPKSALHLPLVQLKYEWEIIRRARRFKPDVLLAVGEPAITHASQLCDARSMLFTDTEHATLQNKLSFPFADRIYTPQCYQDDLGEKQIYYPGFHELAYLHPNRFEPDSSVLDEVGLTTNDSFVILRTVDWQALHDIGDSGFDDVVDVVTQLEATGAEVLITAEGDLPDAVSHCDLDIEPHRIHDLMAYSDLFIGESATMASESAVLGTPAVFVSSSRRGYTDELEEKYGLVFNFSDENRHQAGLEKAIEILDDDNAKIWAQHQERLLEDKIDTTEFILEQITKLIN